MLHQKSRHRGVSHAAVLQAAGEAPGAAPLQQAGSYPPFPQPSTPQLQERHSPVAFGGAAEAATEAETAAAGLPKQKRKQVRRSRGLPFDESSGGEACAPMGALCFAALLYMKRGSPPGVGDAPPIAATHVRCCHAHAATQYVILRQTRSAGQPARALQPSASSPQVPAVSYFGADFMQPPGEAPAPPALMFCVRLARQECAVQTNLTRKQSWDRSPL